MTEFSIPDSYFVREYDKDVEESVLNSFEFKLLQKELFREIEDFPKYSTAFAILLDAYTGARAGEVVAWKWSDISFKKGIISIRRAESRHSKRNEQGEKIKGYDYIIGDVKTKNSRRNLPLSKNALKVLHLLKDWQKNITSIQIGFLSTLTVNVSLPVSLNKSIADYGNVLI